MNSVPRNEISRKAIHLFASVIPLGYYLVIPDRWLVLKILFLCSVFSIAIELGRNRLPGLELFFNRWFYFMLRKHESRGKTTGATWLLIGSCITIGLFPKEIAVPALLFLTVGDTFAAIVGITFPMGRIREKTISGGLAGMILSLAVILPIMQNIDAGILILGGFAAMLFELSPIPLNDNLTIPVLSGFVMLSGSQLL